MRRKRSKGNDRKQMIAGAGQDPAVCDRVEDLQPFSAFLGHTATKPTEDSQTISS